MPRKTYGATFNRSIPPLFKRGGMLYAYNQLGTKIAFLVEMPEYHATAKEWTDLYKIARRELAEQCFSERRSPSVAEISQLDWLKDSGHVTWFIDSEPLRSNINALVRKLEMQVDELRKFAAEKQPLPEKHLEALYHAKVGWNACLDALARKLDPLKK